jgi:hypothetical protein
MRIASPTGRWIGPLLLAAVAAVPVGLAVAQSAPPTPPAAPAPAAPPPPPVDPTPPQSVEGVVDGYNLDPHGEVDSVVLKAGDRLAQFNLPPHLSAVLTAAAPVGQKVTLAGVPERAVGDRTLYRLTKLTGPDGKSIDVGTPGAEQPAHVDGTVKRLNISPRGEVDGVLLDTGDFVHTGPESAATLAVGAKLTADGPAQPMLDGHKAIEATTVNGTPVRRPPPPPHGGPDGPHGPGDPHGPGGPPPPPGGPAAPPPPAP